MSQLFIPSSFHREGRTIGRSRARARTVHVVVDWSASGSDARSSGPARVELESESAANAEPRWSCRQPSDLGWEEALTAAGCEEVVLTAEIDDDPAAKHLVLGLAERLTRELAATHPLIRVRFVSRPRASVSRSSTTRQ